MENQQNNGQIQETVMHAPIGDNMQQPMADGAQNKKKKTIIIAAIIGALVVLFGGAGVGVYAFMNSPQMKAVSVFDKVQKAKKSEGDMKITGEISMPAGFGKTETVDVKIDGTYGVSRQAEDKKHFTLDATADFSGSRQVQEVIDTLNVNGAYRLSLTEDMLLEWSGLGQSGTYELTQEQQKPIKDYIESKTSEKTEAEKANQELMMFALKGYTPTLTNEGNKVVVTIVKTDLEKIADTIEKNIKADPAKFKELYQKTNKDIDESSIDAMIEAVKNGEFKSQVETALKALEDFEVKTTFEDLGSSVKQTVDVKMLIVQEQSGKKIRVKSNMNGTTTYYM